LSALWPAGLEWELKESEVGMFGHLFIAKQNG
jgi:hypothetical protein